MTPSSELSYLSTARAGAVILPDVIPGKKKDAKLVHTKQTKVSQLV